MVFGKGHRVHVQEVIPMKSKAYRAVDVNRVDLAAWLKDRDEGLVHAGLDIGKDEVLSTLRWGPADFDRPWRTRNPLGWFAWQSC